MSYVNILTEWWPPEAIAESIGATNSKGCNIINLSFWRPMSDGTSDPADAALVWSDAVAYFGTDSEFGSTTQEIQANLRNRYHQQNAKVLVSAFGANIEPTTHYIDPEAVGENLAMFVIENQLDGVDVDYEDNAAMEAGTAVPWLITMTEAMLRTFASSAPGQKFYISHAPQAPYFMDGKYPQNYVDLYYSSVGDSIVGYYLDFFNIQFYNQGTSEYLTYETLFLQSTGWSLGTAVLQITEKGIAMNKLLVGKPVTEDDVYNSGYVPQDELANIFRTASQGVWYYCDDVGGVMNWQFASDTTAWMKEMKDAINC